MSNRINLIFQIRNKKEILNTGDKKLIVILTQYKRNNLERQLEAVKNQTLQPDYLVVFQNENHVNIENLKEKYNFIHVKSDHNTKFFGRFAYCFTFPVEVCIVMDDDIIPAKKCFEKYVHDCLKLNAIMGANARFGINNPNNKKLSARMRSFTIRPRLKADFVGHLWCFKKEWLHNMFAIPPYTYDTGEDMHLCFSSKVLEGIDSYLCEHTSMDQIEDTARDSLAGDNHASFRTTPNELRSSVEKYFIENYGLKMVE